jgi:hypothetical protein
LNRAPPLDAAGVAADYAISCRGVSEPAVELESAFDDALKHEAVLGCEPLIEHADGTHIGHQYQWTRSPAVFQSGVEAWLQHEVVQALASSGWALSAGADRPFVIRVVHTERRTTWTVSSELCRYVMVPFSYVDRYVRLASAMRRILSFGPIPYSDNDPWCTTNLIGGSYLEYLLRSEHLGLAYGAMHEILDSPAAYENALSLGEPDEWVLSTYSLRRALGSLLARPNERCTERLVRAPLRYTVFHEMGHSLSGMGADPSLREFERDRGADGAAVSMLVSLERSARVRGVTRDALGTDLSASLGMGVHLQMERVDRALLAHKNAITWLGRDGATGIPPQLNRLSWGEVTLRYLSAAGVPLAGEDRLIYALAGALNEMQVIFGVIAGLLLARLGGTIHLHRLCSGIWEPLWMWMSRDGAPSPDDERAARWYLQPPPPGLSSLASDSWVRREARIILPALDE